MRPRLSVVLPAFNEAKTIVPTLLSWRQAVPDAQLIVVADGTDTTRELASDVSGVHVIGTPVRRGKGRGVADGIEHASGEYVGYVDADGKVPATEVTKIWPEFERGADLVVGSRRAAGASIERAQPWYRRAGSRAFHTLMRQVTGLHQISDSQCGFKFFRRDVAVALFAERQIDGYMFDVEILALAHRAKWRVHEVPVRWSDDGDSRLELWRGNWQNIRDLLRIARRLR